MEKEEWKVGQKLLGTYTWTNSFHFFEVIGHTKSGAPRLRELNKNVKLLGSTPAQSSSLVTLEDGYTGLVKSARWSKNEGWGVTLKTYGDEGTRYHLSEYDPNRKYISESYY